MASGIGEFRALMILSRLSALHFTDTFRLRFKEWQDGWQQSQNPSPASTPADKLENFCRSPNQIFIALTGSCSRPWGGGPYGQRIGCLDQLEHRRLVRPQTLGCSLGNSTWDESGLVELLQWEVRVHWSERWDDAREESQQVSATGVLRSDWDNIRRLILESPI